ncbi:MAG TPA: HlyD family secretion protein [Gemmatimonadales bacterium]|jgi:membrane fusion protein (multidrug efflux system)
MAANKTPFIIVGVLVIAAGVWGGKKYLYSRNHVTTDNAEIDGRLEPVASKLQAFVIRVPVEDNQVVQTGDTLLVLDARDLDADVAKAQADLAAAIAMAGNGHATGQLSAQVTAAEATASGAAAAVTTAEAASRRANSDLERIKGLAAKQIVAAQQLDAAQAAADAAAGNLQAAQRQEAAAKAQVGAAGAALSGGDARVQAARATLETAELKRSYAVVTAPFPAIVSKRSAEPGMLMQPGQTAMTLVPLKEIWVTANVKETRLGHVQVGDSVSFTVDSYGGKEFEGTVQSLSPATGARFALLPPDNATGNFTKVVQNVPVRIAITSAADPKYPLRPGMSVEVAIRTLKS